MLACFVCKSFFFLEMEVFKGNHLKPINKISILIYSNNILYRILVREEIIEIKGEATAS